MTNSLFKTIAYSKPAIALEVLAVVVFGVYTSRAVLSKRAAEAQIAALEAEIGALSREKDSLGELIEYAQTDSFITKEAREKLNLTAPGESVVVIPDIDSPEPEQKDEPEALGVVLGDANVALWWEYFFDPKTLAKDRNETAE